MMEFLDKVQDAGPRTAEVLMNPLSPDHW
jgi:hypothetical protein